MNGWDKIDKAKEGGGIFVKLKDKQSIQGVFVGEPYVYYQAFGSKEEHPEYVPGTSLRFKINFVTKENGVYAAKIFNQGITTGKLLKKYRDEYGENHLFKIEREGSGKDDTVYHILPKGEVSPDSMKAIMEVKLQNLNGGGDTSFNTKDYESGPEPHDEEPGNF